LKNRALATILKAKGGATAASLLALLPEDRRSTVEALLTEVPADAGSELRRLRQQEFEAFERRHAERLGPAWKELAPGIRYWAWGRIKLA
jgi:hypothetical protein